jgi:eukaryotic-like serine/threonine-protein kinase
MNIDVVWLQQQFPDCTSLTSLAQGGQKQVFSGHHKKDGAIVLKIYHPQSDEQRIIREIEAVQFINCMRVPKIFEYGTKQSPLGNCIWLREEKVDGENLRQILQFKNKLPPQETILLALHMLEALNLAEEKNIVHRDVKPENIIIDQQGDAWLVDFGLARHLSQESLTNTSNFFGACTPGYAPIEQFKNQKMDIDSRSDLFSLGVTLYECVEGLNPFINGALNHMDILSRVERQVFPRILQPIDANNQFADLVHAMTRPKVNQRISTIKEALEWIQEICKAEGVI